MAEYIKEKWSADFPDRAGQEVRPTEAVENTLDYDVLFPQYLSEDPVVFNQQNRTVSQLVSNDARLYERISATAADINAHLTDAKAHASGISGNAASASKLQTGRKIHRVLFDGTRDITLPDFTGCGEAEYGPAQQRQLGQGHLRRYGRGSRGQNPGLSVPCQCHLHFCGREESGNVLAGYDLGGLCHGEVPDRGRGGRQRDHVQGRGQTGRREAQSYDSRNSGSWPYSRRQRKSSSLVLRGIAAQLPVGCL